jgi:hypothetical protein
MQLINQLDQSTAIEAEDRASSSAAMVKFNMAMIPSYPPPEMMAVPLSAAHGVPVYENSVPIDQLAAADPYHHHMTKAPLPSFSPMTVVESSSDPPLKLHHDSIDDKFQTANIDVDHNLTT